MVLFMAIFWNDVFPRSSVSCKLSHYLIFLVYASLCSYTLLVVFRKRILKGSVPVQCAISFERPMTGHQMARSIVFWDGLTRPGVRMPMTRLSWKILKRSRRKELKQPGAEPMRQNASKKCNFINHLLLLFLSLCYLFVYLFV